MLGQLDIYKQRNETEPLSHPIQKKRWTQNGLKINLRAETIKLDENIDE